MVALSWNVDHAWVAGGVVLTGAFGLALLYWIDQEWRSLDEKRRRGPAAPPPPPAEPSPPPPAGSPSPPPAGPSPDR